MLPRYWHLGQHKKLVVLQGMRRIGAVEHVEQVNALALVVRSTQSVTGDWNLRQLRVALGSVGASPTPPERVPACGISLSTAAVEQLACAGLTALLHCRPLQHTSETYVPYYAVVARRAQPQ
jgi:hypothetical protein